jgi:hypothetical protein
VQALELEPVGVGGLEKLVEISGVTRHQILLGVVAHLSNPRELHGGRDAKARRDGAELVAAAYDMLDRSDVIDEQRGQQRDVQSECAAQPVRDGHSSRP